jgi:hypothetical protein
VQILTGSQPHIYAVSSKFEPKRHSTSTLRKSSTVAATQRSELSPKLWRPWRGGVIIFGVSEDGQARAKAAPGVDITDAEVRRIRQVAASLLSPLPLFDVVTIPDETTTERQAASSESTGDQNELPSTPGFILVAVPRSLKAPHAVLVNDDLRYPKRNGPGRDSCQNPR